MGKTYRTAKGQLVNMDEIRMENDKTIASGNMGVNARGDKVRGGRIVQPVSERVAPYHKATKLVTKGSVRPKPTVDREEPAGKVEGKIKTREDGTSYEEVTMEDGSIEVKKTSSRKKKSD